jgi:hypothetical protein
MYFGDDGPTIDAATLEDHDPAWLRARRAIVATRRSVEALYVADEINRAYKKSLEPRWALSRLPMLKMMRCFGVRLKLHAGRSTLVQFARGVGP